MSTSTRPLTQAGEFAASSSRECGRTGDGGALSCPDVLEQLSSLGARVRRNAPAPAPVLCFSLHREKSVMGLSRRTVLSTAAVGIATVAAANAQTPTAPGG